MLSLFVIAAVATCASAQLLGSLTCTNANPYIKILQENNVQLFPSAKSSPFCGIEFFLYGTCCNTQDLMDYAKKDYQSIKDAVEVVNTEYEGLSNTFPQLLKFVKAIAFAPEVEGGHRQKDHINKMIKTARNFVRTSEFLEFDKTYNFLGAADAAKFKLANNYCWTNFTRARNSSLCFTCSGKADQYFKGGKGVITQHTCKTIIGQCESSMSKLVMFTHLLMDVLGVANKFKEMGIDFNIQQRVNTGTIKSFWQEFIATDVPLSLVRYERNKSVGQYSYELCSKFIKLREKTLVQLIAGIFSKTASWSVELDGSIVDHVQNNKAAIEKKIVQYERRTIRRFITTNSAKDGPSMWDTILDASQTAPTTIDPLPLDEAAGATAIPDTSYAPTSILSSKAMPAGNARRLQDISAAVAAAIDNNGVGNAFGNGKAFGNGNGNGNGNAFGNGGPATSDAVIYTPSNGQYASVIGAPGTGQLSADRAVSPMNMAQMFP